MSIVLQQQLTLWFRDLEDAMTGQALNKDNNDMEEAFILYRKSQKLMEMGDALASSVFIYHRNLPLSPVKRAYTFSHSTSFRKDRSRMVRSNS